MNLANLGSGVERIGRYNGNNKATLHKCSCGEEFSPRPDNALLGSQCKTCRYEKTKKSNATDPEHYDRQLAALATGIFRIGEYINAQTEILHSCYCGKKWKAQPASLLRGCRCNDCGSAQTAKKRRYTHEEYLELLSSKEIEASPLELYIDTATAIEHKCGCGVLFKRDPRSVLRGFTCRSCMDKNINAARTDRVSSDRYLAKLEKAGIKVVPLEEYQGTRIHIQHRCNCGNEDWRPAPTKVIQGATCTKCTIVIKNNDALYLIEDAAGHYKIGQTSWVLGRQRFELLNRRRRYYDAPEFVRVLRHIRVGVSTATKYETTLLHLYTDNPYKHAEFGGVEERRLSRQDLDVILEYYDKLALEHAEVGEL